jgi:hypothetical protein
VLLPVLIDGTTDILPKHGYKFGNGYNVKIKVLDPVEPSSFGTDNPDVLAASLNRIMKDELNTLRRKTL